MKSGIPANDEHEIDLKKVLFKIVSIWPYVLASTVLAFSVVFIYSRYADRVFQVEASVLIKNASGLDFSELIFESEGGKQHREISNETFILQSIALTEETVKEAQLTVHYFRETSALQRLIELDEGAVPFKLERLSYEDSEAQVPLSIVRLAQDGFSLDDQGTMNVVVEGKYGQPFFIGLDSFLISLNRNTRLKTTAEYFVQTVPLRSEVGRFVNLLNVQPVSDNATILRLSIESLLPSRDIRFLNQHLGNYLEQNLEEKNEQSTNSISFISNELELMADSLRTIESKLQVFKANQMVGGNVSEDAQRTLEYLMELESRKAELLLNAKYFEYIQKYFSSRTPDEVLIHPSSFGVVDPILQAQAQELIELQRKVGAANSQVEGLSTLKGEFERRINQLSQSLLNYVQNLNETNQIQLNDVAGRVKEVERSMRGLSYTEIELMNIVRLQKLYENMYLLLMEKRTEAEILKSSNTSDFKIVDSPRLTSTGPIRPKKRMLYIVGLMIGLFFPITVYVVFDYFDDRVDGKESIERLLDIPFLGHVPSVESGKMNSFFISEHPKSLLAESYRTIRANLNYMQIDSIKVILVSSLLPGEGKTFVSAGLGESLCSSKKNVVVVGADLRKPQVNKNLGVSNDVGLSNYLIGLSSMSEVIQPTQQKNLDVIPSGPIPPNPLELLESGRMKELLTELSSMYDYVVVDTAPFGLVGDAMMLFQQADVSLIVIRNRASKISDVKAISETSMKMSNSKFAIVLNDVKKGHNSYGYRYKSGDGYYSV